jgi:plastocyanin
MDKVSRLLIALVILVSGLVVAPSGILASKHLAWRIPIKASQTLSDPQVDIENFLFVPNVVLIEAGSTVHWTNGDGVAHTVTSDSGAFDSGALFPGESFELPFDAVGTYPYHCSIHPSMTGQVIVVDEIQRVFLPVVIR